MDKRIDTIVQEYVSEVSHKLGLSEAYLYGSQVKGTSNDYSDVDIAFVYRTHIVDIEKFYLLYGQLYDIATEFEEDIEPVLLEPSDDFFREVKRTGKRIYI